ncbi:MAG: hypothetical protein LBE80_04720 [Deltaproteobacteria bacterium]|jgi:hypothetical protein|nr:hypothetical protein [Deltaproteobacteria bacterium]
MKSKYSFGQKPTVTVKPGFKLILLMILSLILLQFLTFPARDQSQLEPKAFEEMASERQAKCPELEGSEALDELNGQGALN